MKETILSVFNFAFLIGTEITEYPPINIFTYCCLAKSEVDQEMPESQTTDQPTTPQGSDTEDQQPYDNKSTIKVNSIFSSSMS